MNSLQIIWIRLAYLADLPLFQQYFNLLVQWNALFISHIFLDSHSHCEKISPIQGGIYAGGFCLSYFQEREENQLHNSNESTLEGDIWSKLSQVVCSFSWHIETQRVFCVFDIIQSWVESPNCLGGSFWNSPLVKFSLMSWFFSSIDAKIFLICLFLILLVCWIS